MAGSTSHEPAARRWLRAGGSPLRQFRPTGGDASDTASERPEELMISPVGFTYFSGLTWT